MAMRYSNNEELLLDCFAEQCSNKVEMYSEIKERNLPKLLGRTMGGICKQIEIRKGWFWAAMS